MIPVRENSEVAIIYPDLWDFPQKKPSMFPSIYGGASAAASTWLTSAFRLGFVRRLRDMGCVKRHHEVENFNKSDVHGDLSIGGFQVIGPFLHVAMVTRGSPFFFRNPCF